MFQIQKIIPVMKTSGFLLYFYLTHVFILNQQFHHILPSGTPAEHRLLQHALPESDKCELRESEMQSSQLFNEISLIWEKLGFEKTVM